VLQLQKDESEKLLQRRRTKDQNISILTMDIEPKKLLNNVKRRKVKRAENVHKKLI
jgi:hypothetical protein